MTWGKLSNAQEGRDRSLCLEDTPKISFHSSAEGYDLKTLWLTSVLCKIRLQGRDSNSMPQEFDPVYLNTLPSISNA